MYSTSNLDYAMKYSQDKVFILSLLILGNSFPVTEHPFEIDKDGNIIYERQQGQKYEKLNPSGYCGKSLQQGYQSHFTLGFLSFLFFYFYLSK